MATWLWNNGNRQKFPARRVQHMLQNGWSVIDDQEQVGSEDQEKQVIPEEEADLNDSGKLNPTEVRAAARDAGIKGWKNARISTLKDKLGYE